MERNVYVRPEVEIVPYYDKDILQNIAGGNNPSWGGDTQFAKESDDFNEGNEEDYEGDLWASERQGFGLQEWNEEE